ncbi:MAG: transposase [Deltaproteobacteria bacterium]|nr:transposase [Deltaproteobacteria bacterium]MBK8013943.1 transposase [Deltaproteobacteria bacterium]
MAVVLSFVTMLLTATIRVLGTGGAKGLAAENALLRHQLLVLRRARRRAPSLRPIDRLILGLGSLLVSPKRISKVAVVVRPSTLLGFHRGLVRRKYHALFSPGPKSKPGPKGPSTELVRAIVAIKERNPRFGSPRIASIVCKTFGVDIDKDVVRRVLAQHYRPKTGGSGPSWLTFLGHAKDSLWSVDLFRCESIALTTHWVMVVLDQFTRRIIGFGIQPGPVDGPRLCQMFNDAISGSGTPERLSTDHDPLFRSHRWTPNLRVLEVDEVKTVPYVPISHPFVERLIGTIRRELLDQTLFWNAVDLERKLTSFRHYYNAHRVHSSLGGDTPAVVAGGPSPARAELASFGWQSHCGDLFKLPVAA